MPEISRNRQNARYAEDVVNVKDFGATGDGVTDDTAAIQAAIDYANSQGYQGNSAGGKEVHVPAGFYVISSTLTLYGGFGGEERISLIGEGSGSSKLFLANESLCDMIKYNSTSGYNHCRIEGLILDGNRSNQTNPTASITNITQASDAVVTTSSAHGLSTGDFVSITGVSGMTEINGKHSNITVLSTTTFSLDEVNSNSYTAYTTGGTVTQQFRGIYALRAFSGSRLTDLKINDIAGVAIDCQEVSNAPFFENIGITRAGTHGLYIHSSNNDGINVTNMEIGTAGMSGIGNCVKIYNITGGGHGNYVFINLRCDNGGAPGGTSDLISLEDAPVSFTFIQPRWRLNSDTHLTYNCINIEGNGIPYIFIAGYGCDSAPVAVTQNLINDQISGLIHEATIQEPIVSYNAPNQQVEVTSTSPTHKLYLAGESDPRFQLAPIGPYWGSGSGTPDIRIQRDSSSQLRIADSSSNEQGLRASNLVSVGGSLRLDELASSPAGVSDKCYLYCKDNGAGKTQLIARFGTGAEQVLATEP